MNKVSILTFVQRSWHMLESFFRRALSRCKLRQSQLTNLEASLALAIKSWNLRVCGELSHGLHGNPSLTELPAQLSAQIEIVLVFSVNDTGFQPVE